jgi:glucose/arabinose dehydrogenase
MKQCLALAAILSSLAAFAHAQTIAPSTHGTGAGVPPFTVRPGYRVTLAADGLQEARFIEFDDKGTLYLSQPGRGTILALRDPDHDGVYETRTAFVTGKPSAHGMHFKDGWLWFTQAGAVYRARDTKGTGTADEVVTLIPEGKLPQGGHWWRSILVADNGFYTSIGDSGNITDETNTDRQKIWFYDLDGKNRKLFASGIRNTEKLRFRPGTNEVWGCDHGSDNFGAKYGERAGVLQPITDLNPPDEFNRYVEGGFYGHPFIVGDRLPRPEYASRSDILQLAAKSIPPEWNNPPHWANNGWTFLTQDYFPNHKGDAFIAFHGSWNRMPKAGYCIQRILFDQLTGKPYGALTIVSCLQGQQVQARPVDCVEAPDGTVLFTTDDHARIYRISRDDGAGAAMRP